MSYYRTSGKTDRAKCDNCGKAFKFHAYVTTDRDGDLHECPKPRRKKRKKRKVVLDLAVATVPFIVLPREGVILDPDGKRHPVKVGDSITVKVLPKGKFKLVVKVERPK
jgi:hypothetical protein